MVFSELIAGLKDHLNVSRTLWAQLTELTGTLLDTSFPRLRFPKPSLGSSQPSPAERRAVGAAGSLAQLERTMGTIPTLKEQFLGERRVVHILRAAAGSGASSRWMLHLGE